MIIRYTKIKQSLLAIYFQYINLNCAYTFIFLVKQSGEGNHLSSIKPLIALSHQFVMINSYHTHKKKKSKQIICIKKIIKKKKKLLPTVFGFRCRIKRLSLYLQLWIFESSCMSACGHCFNQQHIFFCLYLLIASVKTLDPILI